MKLGRESGQRGLNHTKAGTSRELGIAHDLEMVTACELLRFVITLVFVNTFSQLIIRDKVHQLGENGLSGWHDDSKLDKYYIQKNEIFIEKFTNRHNKLSINKLYGCFYFIPDNSEFINLLMDNEQSICPNCGASLNRKGFGFVCDYCGSSFLSEDHTVMDNKSVDLSNISARHEYQCKNENYIKSSKFVKADMKSKTYRILSSPAYYTNDGQFNINIEFNLYFEYLNNCVEETMYMEVCSNLYIDNPYISILLDEEYIITPEFDRWVGNLASFRIGTDEFEEICESSKVSISSNLMENETIHCYGEFIPYCRRLFNILFDKCKYIYSIHQILISDKNG